MGSPRFAVEFETVQGAALRFGPYEQADAARIAAEFAPHIGRNDFVFSPTTSSSGRPIGAWSLCASGIAAVRVVPCGTRASGRLSRTTWSRSRA
jgi:hypothetical protein